MFFSRDEFRDILIAIAVLTIIFTYPDVYSLPAAFIAVVVSFLLSKIAQKMVAVRYGVVAFFKLWTFGNIVALIFMFLPMIKLAIPGSLVIYPQKFARWKRRYAKWSHFPDITYREVGIITSFGPIVNILLGLFSWFLVSTVAPGNLFLGYFTLVNGWLALSSLLPVKPLDGAKIFTWKPWFWIIMVVVSVMQLAVSVPLFFR